MGRDVQSFGKIVFEVQSRWSDVRALTRGTDTVARRRDDRRDSTRPLRESGAGFLPRRWKRAFASHSRRPSPRRFADGEDCERAVGRRRAPRARLHRRSGNTWLTIAPPPWAARRTLLYRRCYRRGDGTDVVTRRSPSTTRRSTRSETEFRCYASRSSLRSRRSGDSTQSRPREVVIVTLVVTTVGDVTSILTR